MTQRPRTSDEQFATASVDSGFDTVDLSGTPGSTVPVDNTYVSSYTQTGAASGQGAVEQAKDKAGDLVDQAQQKTGQVVDQARGVVASRIADQKDRAAQSLGGVAQALRQTGQQLQDSDQAGVTQYVDSAANQIERISGYLQNTDINDVFDDVERFARQQPALFLGGAFALGLIGARFLKSSSRSTSRSYSGSRSYPTSGSSRPEYRTNSADYTRTSTYGGPASYGTGTGSTSYGTGSTSYGTGSTSYGTGTAANIDDAPATRSVGGMEER